MPLFLKLFKLQSGKQTSALFGVTVNYTTPLYNRKYTKTLIHIIATARYPDLTAEAELRAEGFCDRSHSAVLCVYIKHELNCLRKL